MICLRIKNKKNGAELNLRCGEVFMGVKTFYITKRQSKNAENIVDLLSRFDNDEITFLYRRKENPTSVERPLRIYLYFYKIQNIGIIKLFVGDTVYFFSLRKSSYNVCDNESPDVYFGYFRKMSYEPYVY